MDIHSQSLGRSLGRDSGALVSASQTERLTRVGPGTPVGELLRRYWHPFAAVSQVDDLGIMPVRLLGENLVAYRAKDGSYGLVDRKCPHRRDDMANGIIEDE